MSNGDGVGRDRDADKTVGIKKLGANSAKIKFEGLKCKISKVMINKPLIEINVEKNLY